MSKEFGNFKVTRSDFRKDTDSVHIIINIADTKNGCEFKFRICKSKNRLKGTVVAKKKSGIIEITNIDCCTLNFYLHGNKEYLKNLYLTFIHEVSNLLQRNIKIVEDVI